MERCSAIIKMLKNEIKIYGKISTFGGSIDNGMTHQEGLAFFEHLEADLRPDLFFPRSTDPTEGTSKRLRNSNAYYIAVRVIGNREMLQRSVWKVENPKTGQAVIASLCDYGPHQSTGRAIDMSDATARALRLQTDDEAVATLLTEIYHD